jgi:hypothetical protein
MEQKLFKWVVLAIVVAMLCAIGWYATTQVGKYEHAMKQKAVAEGAMGAVRSFVPFGQIGGAN